MALSSELLLFIVVDCCCLFIVRCCVVGVKEHKLDLSSRGSHLTSQGEGVEVRDPEIRDLGDLTEGKLVRGYVKSVTDLGAYVR